MRMERQEPYNRWILQFQQGKHEKQRDFVELHVTEAVICFNLATGFLHSA